MLLAPEATLGDGRYRLEHRRGFGGMATVWLAIDERLERPVAVKVLADTLALEPDFVRRFEREARIAAGLSHPNLVLLYDFGTERGRPFLVSEWVDGPDLHELSRDGGQVYGGELAAALLGVLQYIHDEGVIHRDVKPSNVLVDDEGRPRLTDFGIAQPTDAARLTRTGMVLGTAPFVAPEVIAGEPSTPRSDLYSVGRLLRHQLGEEIPPRLERLSEWLCRENPELRPASAHEALESLDNGHRERRGVVRTTESARQVTSTDELPITRDLERPGPPNELSDNTPRDAGQRPVLWVAAGLAGLAIAVFAILAAEDGGDPRSASPPVSSGKEAAGGTGREPASAPATEPSTPSSPAETAATPPPATEAAAYSIPGPKPNPKPDKGATLNQQGFELIAAGDPEKAVKALEKAVSEFPAGTDDLNYAYSLFNLGHALRLAGRPAEAIPVLERRLEIPNQSETVAQELELARQEAGL